MMPIMLQLEDKHRKAWTRDVMMIDFGVVIIQMFTVIIIIMRGDKENINPSSSTIEKGIVRR